MPASVNITGTIWVEAWPAPVVARYLPFCRSWEFQHATVDGGRCLACLYCCRLSAAWQPAAVEAVRAAHPEGRFYVYPAGHGFNCTDRVNFDAPSAALAFERSLSFLHEYLR